jgi:hypothetical protein
VATLKHLTVEMPIVQESPFIITIISAKHEKQIPIVLLTKSQVRFYSHFCLGVVVVSGNVWL